MYLFVKVGKYFEKINRKIGNISLNNVLVVWNNFNNNKDVKIIYEKTMCNNCIDVIEQIKMRMEYSEENLLGMKNLLIFFST